MTYFLKFLARLSFSVSVCVCVCVFACQSVYVRAADLKMGLYDFVYSECEVHCLAYRERLEAECNIKKYSKAARHNT